MTNIDQGQGPVVTDDVATDAVGAPEESERLTGARRGGAHWRNRRASPTPTTTVAPATTAADILTSNEPSKVPEIELQPTAEPTVPAAVLPLAAEDGGARVADADEDTGQSAEDTEQSAESTGHEGDGALGGMVAPPPSDFRRGAREVRVGSSEMLGAAVESTRRFLPRKMEGIPHRRLGLVLALALVVVVLIVATVASFVGGALAGPPAVVVAEAGPATIQATPGGVGALSASPQHVAVVSLNVQGVTAPIEVTSVDVVAGQQVTAGTPLLQLDPTAFEENKAQVAASLQQAQETLLSAQAAAASGPIAGSGQAYLAVQVPTLAGEVAIQQQLYQIALGNSTSLDAPISGNISYVRTAAGQVVSPGTSLVQIIDPSVVNVSAGLQLSDLQSVAVGDSAVLTPTELPGVHLDGKVIAVSSSAANGGLEGTAVISATNGGPDPVPVGTQVFVTISAPVHAAVSVPTVAVLNAQLNPTVAVVDGNHVEFRNVQVGATDANRTQIVSGLRPGQRVAMTNLQALSNGDQVTVASSST
jgi:RND family efflux transporter MFP subunit